MNLRDLPDMSAAYKQVQERNDGNLANNAPPYDKVTRRDVITGALGKDEMGGKRKKHDCAKKVNYKKEEYDCIPEQHTMLEDGTVTHYDITNGEVILENVPVEELEILISEKHEHFDNYDKNSEVLGETKLGDTAYARARDAGAQRRRTKEYKQGLNRSTTRKEKGMYRLATAQRRTDADLERQKATYDTGAHKGDWDRAKRAKQYKKEAFAFSEVDFEELDLFGEEIDTMTDEQLIDMMEDIILETAEDDQDLIEICEHLEEAELLSEDYYDSAVKASKEASKKPEVKAANRRARVERLKKAAGAAAKKVGSAAKAGLKTAGKAAARGAGYAAGAAQRAASSAKSEFQKGRERGLKGSGSSKPKSSSSSSSSSSDDDGTDGKLDSVLSSIRGSKGTSSGGGSSSASSGGGEKKKKPGMLRRLAGAVGRGLKKAAGKTARAVSSGSDKLAKRLGEEYEHIAHLYESGLFSMEEIENVIEERYKGKHGQSDKEYADSRSQGGKMVSGDSKMSGAEYTHGRRVKAANPGMQPDVGGKTKPKSQGKMDKGTRADLEYRKANLKKEEIEMEEGYKEIDRDKENKMYRRAGNLARTSLSAKGKAKQVAQDKSAKIVSAITRQKENERFKKMGDEKARDNYGG